MLVHRKPQAVKSCFQVWQALLMRKSLKRLPICTARVMNTITEPTPFLYTTSSLMDLMAWDATDQIELINQPLLMIAGSKADTKYMTDQAFSKATNAKNKELFLMDVATHIQTYWKPEYVNQAVEKIVNFYSKNL